MMGWLAAIGFAFGWASVYADVYTTNAVLAGGGREQNGFAAFFQLWLHKYWPIPVKAPIAVLYFAAWYYSGDAAVAVVSIPVTALSAWAAWHNYGEMAKQAISPTPPPPKSP